MIAQDIAAADSDTLKATPAALEFSQISEFGDQTNQLILKSEGQFNRKSKLPEIETEITNIHLRLDDQLEILKDTTLIYRIDKLSKEQREMELVRQRVDQWNESVMHWQKDAFASIETLEFHRSTWELTRDSLERHLSETEVSDTSATAALSVFLKNVEDYLTEIEGFLSSMNTWKTQLNAMLADFALTHKKLNDGETLLSTKQKELRTKIWVPRYPPIWRMERDVDSAPAPRVIWNQIKTDRSIITAFFRSNDHFTYYVLFFFLITFGIILYLRFQGEKFYSSFYDELESARIILNNPFLSALVITSFWALLFGDTPSEFGRIIAPLLLIPVTFLLWRLNPEWPLRRLVVFVILYLAYFILPMFNDIPYAQRIIMLVLSTGILGYLIWYRKERSSDMGLKKWWFGLISILTNIFVLLCAISIFTNVMGSLELTQLLLYSVVGTLLAFMLLRVLVELTLALALLLLLGPLYQRSHILKKDSQTVMKYLRKLGIMVAIWFWLVTILDLLTIRAQVGTAIIDFFTYRINVGEVSFSLWNIIAFFLIIRISSILSVFIRYVLDMEIYPRANLKEGVPTTISVMVRYTIAFIGILLALAAAGIGMSELTIAVGALGVGIGFGLQNIVSNFISGIILALERPIKIGDVVVVDNVTGIVRDIGIRASQIRTYDGADVLVPNGALISNKVTNWTLSDNKNRVTIDVRVPFDSDLKAVSKLLLDTSAALPDILNDPLPYLNFTGIGESAMEIKLYIWLADRGQILERIATMRIAIYDALQNAGYEIPVKRLSVEVDDEKTVD